MAERTTRKRHEPVGPFAPPLPHEADREEGQPFAVARDEDAKSKSFLPTTQFKDQMDHEVADRWRDPQVTKPPREGKSGTEETEAQQRHPSGHKPSDQTGYVELDDQEE